MVQFELRSHTSFEPSSYAGLSSDRISLTPVTNIKFLKYEFENVIYELFLLLNF